MRTILPWYRNKLEATWLLAPRLKEENWEGGSSFCARLYSVFFPSRYWWPQFHQVGNWQVQGSVLTLHILWGMYSGTPEPQGPQKFTYILHFGNLTCKQGCRFCFSVTTGHVFIRYPPQRNFEHQTSRSLHPGEGLHTNLCFFSVNLWWMRITFYQGMTYLDIRSPPLDPPWLSTMYRCFLFFSILCQIAIIYPWNLHMRL